MFKRFRKPQNEPVRASDTDPARNLGLLAAINGKAVYQGDKLYSAWHGQADYAVEVFADDERNVYIVFENIGHAKLESCIIVPSSNIE